MAACRPVLRVLSHGPIDEGLLRAVGADLSARIPAPCVLDTTGLDLDTPWIDERAQLDADALLALLESRVPGSGEQWVCVTSHDMGNRIFAFFFGRARLHGKVALVSVARLDPAHYGFKQNRDLVVRRCVKEILHELGHNAGLRHCAELTCLMHFSSTVEAIDLRGDTLCPSCLPALDGFLGAG